MKIVKIANHSCMRVQKEALPLIAKGYDVHLICQKIPPFGDHYKTISVATVPDQLFDNIALHKDADIFHVHNEPSWYVSCVKEVFPNKPVVLDIHDTMLVRVNEDDEENTRISVDERNNFTLADAHVFVSNTVKSVCQKEFSLSQPNIVLPSYVPKRFIRIDPWKWLGGVVYEGRLDLPEKIKRNKNLKFFSYCDFTEIAKELHKNEIMLFLYLGSKSDGVQEHYGDTASFQGGYVFNEMIRKIGRHDWGLVGNLGNHPAWQAAMPNKLFEYMCAGVPPVVIQAKEAAEFVLEHDVGIVVESIEELKDRWKEKRWCRKNIFEKRSMFYMENHIGKLESLYHEFV